MAQQRHDIGPGAVLDAVIRGVGIGLLMGAVLPLALIVIVVGQFVQMAPTTGAASAPELKPGTVRPEQITRQQRRKLAQQERADRPVRYSDGRLSWSFRVQYWARTTDWLALVRRSVAAVTAVGTSVLVIWLFWHFHHRILA